MATRKPVPSTAALNALRGVVFTTSCSVILLAEERRRRTKLARATIENARKLHTVRGRRGSTVSAEGVCHWEPRLTELDDDVLATLPSGINRPRRRPLKPSPPSGVTGFKQDHFNSLYTDKYAPNVSDGGLSQMEDSTNPLQLSHQSPRSKASRITLRHQVPNLFLDTTKRKILPSRSSFKLGGRGSQTNEVSLRNLKTKLALPRPRRATVTEPSTKASDQNLDVAAAVGQPPTSSGSLQGVPKYTRQNAHRILTRLLNSLNHTPASQQAMKDNLASAASLFQDLATRRKLPPGLYKKIEISGSRLFEFAINQDITCFRSVLETIAQLESFSWPTLIRFCLLVTKSGSLSGLQRCLCVLAKGGLTNSMNNEAGVYRLIKHHQGDGDGFSQIHAFYQRLVENGLFGDSSISNTAQCEIRLYIAKEALLHGDEQFARSELLVLSSLDTHYSSKYKVYGLIVRLEVGCGNWELAREALMLLRKLHVGQPEAWGVIFNDLIDWITRTQDADGLEQFSRHCAAGFKQKFSGKWMLRVLRSHGVRDDLEGALSWLEFCAEHGFSPSVRTAFNINYECQRKWSRSLEDSALLHNRLSQVLPSLPESLPKSARMREKKETRETIDRLGAISEVIALDHMWEAQAFEDMSLAAKALRWADVSELYHEYFTSGGRFSSRLLRLAVDAQLRPDPHGRRTGNELSKASALLDKAHDAGNDVSQALSPLLLYRLRHSSDPVQLLDEFSSEGLYVHQSVYNNIVQLLTVQGRFLDALAICQIAAKEANADGPFYSKQSFSNIMFLYIATEHYQNLGEVIEAYLNDKSSWCGSKICKESIKLGMKALAKRVATDQQLKQPSHKDMLFLMGSALEYCKSCRSAVVGETKRSPLATADDDFAAPLATDLEKFSENITASDYASHANEPRVVAAGAA